MKPPAKLSWVACVLAFCTFGCSKPQPKPATTPQSVDTKHFAILEQTSKKLGWKASLSLSPSPAISGKETAFRVKLVDAHSAPIDGAQVRFSLIMPLMNMGRNEFTAAPAGDGAYSGHGTFPMEGIWIVQTNIVKDNHKARFEFEVLLNE